MVRQTEALVVENAMNSYTKFPGNMGKGRVSPPQRRAWSGRLWGKLSVCRDEFARQRNGAGELDEGQSKQVQ